MNEVSIILSTLAILFSLIALIVGCVGISMVCGFLRSTHTVQWQPLPTPGLGLDEEETELEQLKKEINKPKDFGFMEEVTDHTNW